MSLRLNSEPGLIAEASPRAVFKQGTRSGFEEGLAGAGGGAQKLWFEEEAGVPPPCPRKPFLKP